MCKLAKIAFFVFLGIGLSLTGMAQEVQDSTRKKVIQFTGVIFTADSATVIPGVHIYTPVSGRGTTSNPYGFFSMPALEGDSIIFSSVGFERVSYVVPAHDKPTALRILVYLKEDVTYLEEVEVFPYPTEATFKAAVLAAQLPNQRDYDNLEAWMNSEVMRSMYWNLPASPNMNHRYFMQQQMNAQIYRVQPPSNPLLNPFAWATFIRSLKNK
jgi:hypothetical protein